jgi:MFS superfamily sulfate permease-like transporter
MKVKRGSTVSVPTCMVCIISAIAAVPPAMLTATFLNVEPQIGLYVKVAENLFHHFL